jgi:N-acetylglucosaminyldiphosphoundecaprenol N-acetyl-beta-D-mannosaminyltransferase
MRERRKFFDIYIDSFSLNDLNLIKKGDFIVTLNMDHLKNSKNDPDFAQKLRKADWIIADGISIILLVHNVYKGSDFRQKIKKIPGIDLAEKLISNSQRVAFLGSTEKNIQEIRKKFSEKLVFAHHGFFLEQEEEKIVQDIKNSSADLLLVALGCPKQEKFLAKYAKTLENTTKIGVGGAFDIWSKDLKRAPKFIQKMNLEWLFRIFQEPFRIFRFFSNVHSFVLFFVSSLFDEG